MQKYISHDLEVAVLARLEECPSRSSLVFIFENGWQT